MWFSEALHGAVSLYMCTEHARDKVFSFCFVRDVAGEGRDVVVGRCECVETVGATRDGAHLCPSPGKDESKAPSQPGGSSRHNGDPV